MYNQRQYKYLLLFSTVTTFSLALYYFYFFNSVPQQQILNNAYSAKISSGDFWGAFAPLLSAAAPKVAPPQLHGKASAKYMTDNPSWKTDPPHKLINMTEEDVASMQKSHSWFVNQIIEHTPALEYEAGTTGIVTSAGSILPSPHNQSSKASPHRINPPRRSLPRQHRRVRRTSL